MSSKLVKNIEESTKARLLNYTKKNKENFNAVITRLRMFIEPPIANEKDVKKWSPEWWTLISLLILDSSIKTTSSLIDIELFK